MTKETIEVKVDDFYINNLLLTNDTECAKNYQIVVDYIKDFFIENGTEITPFALCMGVEGGQETHLYKATDKLRPYKNVHGKEPSHGICYECLAYKHKKKFEDIRDEQRIRRRA